MVIVRILPLTLLAAATVLPQSARSHAATEDAAPLRAKAFALARIIGSEQVAIGDQNEKLVGQLTAMFSQDADIASFEKESPGVMDEMIRAMLPIVEAGMRSRLPALQLAYADLYQRNFTTDELDFLIEFYGSGTGQKLLRAADENMGIDAIGKQLLENDFNAGAITPDAVLEDIEAAIPAILGEMSSEDMRALKRLGDHPTFSKLEGIGSQSQQIYLDWSEEYAPGEEAAIDAALDKVIERRFGSLER